jgi:hypothetical protein
LLHISCYFPPSTGQPEGSLNESFPILIQIVGNVTNSTNSTDGEGYSYSYGNGSSIVYEYDDAFDASGDKASSSSSRHGKMMSGGDKKYGDDEKPSSSTGGSKGGKTTLIQLNQKEVERGRKPRLDTTSATMAR